MVVYYVVRSFFMLCTRSIYHMQRVDTKCVLVFFCVLQHHKMVFNYFTCFMFTLCFTLAI